MALGRTVRELNTAMSLREFYEWQVFAQSHPFPADILDLHGAMQLAMLANVNRDPKQTAAYNPSDFLVIRDRQAAEPVAKPVAKPKAKGPTIAQLMRAMISSGG